ATIVVPRRAAQHAGACSRTVFILAPLPDISSHVVKPELVRFKRSHWGGSGIAVIVALDPTELFRPVAIFDLGPSVIACALGGRLPVGPLAPWVCAGNLAILLLGDFAGSS